MADRAPLETMSTLDRPDRHVERGAAAESVHPARLRTLGAFAATYFIWGSNFLAIRHAVETVPPLLMMAARCALAGGALYVWARRRGAREKAAQWGPAFVAGGLLFLGCHGLLAMAERRVASGLSALVLATIPLWMVLLDWARPAGRRPGTAVFGGLSALSWAAGSVYVRAARLPASTPLSTGMQLLGGAALLALAAVGTGELPHFDPRAVTARSLASLAYLVVFGSIVAFTAYVWLLGTTTPARAGSYAFVNPLVAVLLGWIAAREPLTPRVGAATAVIVVAVALITVARQDHPSHCKRSA
jgi:drug/metabolite transporter (DMT)-like permease